MTTSGKVPTAEEYESLVEQVAQLRREMATSRCHQDNMEARINGGDEESLVFSPLHQKPARGEVPRQRTIRWSDFDESSESNKNNNGTAGENDINMEAADINSHNNSDNLDENKEDDEAKGVEIPLLPHDTFSYLAFSKVKSTAMVTSVMVICVQLITLMVLLVDSFGEGGPGNSLGFPAGVNQNTATIQVVALFIITMGQTDLQDSLNTLFIGYQKASLERNLHRPVKKWRWMVSLWIRISITILALVVTFLMICTESDTTQLLLDFTSIEFVTNLDNIFFWLAAYGYLGYGAQKDATLVLNANAPALVLTLNDDPPEEDEDNNSKRRKRSKHRLSVRSQSSRELQSIQEAAKRASNQWRFPRFGFTLSLFFLMLVGWAFIFYKIKSGDFLCQTIYVQFSDDFNPDLAPFSGLYDVGCSNEEYNCRRAQYTEVGHGGVSGTAMFAYCTEGRAWAFTFAENPEDVDSMRACDLKARSSTINAKTQDSYNIMSSADDQWQVTNSRGTLVPFTGFTLQCLDCGLIDGFCGGEGRGTCVNNRCVCEEGWYGRRCEFYEPCEKLEFSEPDMKLLGGRELASQYNILLTDDGERAQVYDRPVYKGVEGSGLSDYIFFNGRRWVLASNLDALENGTFHGYWSDYEIQYLSAEVGVDSREDAPSPDGLIWYGAKVRQSLNRLQGVDLTSRKPFRFLCAACSNLTNPCLYDGVCNEDKSCNCTTGSTGTLCQISPGGDAKCDSYFNTPEFGYDGGDCCEETCVSTTDQECGRGIVKNSFGIETIGFIGFEECRDPSVALAVAGSRTIYDIQKRGVLRCGTSFTTPWFYEFMAEQCRIISSVVLNDPNAIELRNNTNDRFTGLVGDLFDVVFWTDYTANRDIFESSARSSFNFATVPYHFGGFVFAGYPPYSGCADRGDYYSSECLGLKICLVGGSSWADTAKEIFPSQFLSTYGMFEDTVNALENGECNVIGGNQVDVDFRSILEYGFDGDESNYEVGQTMYFKSFETWLTRPDDRVWSRLTSWIFEALVQAEQSNITQATAYEMAETGVFGSEFADMFQKAVRTAGNYGELWDKTMPFTKRMGMNLINDGSTGAIVSYDLGRVMDLGPGPTKNGGIQRILDRGFLKCGVTGGSLGFSEFDQLTSAWKGFEIDLCRGIAAALFDGDATKLDISLTSPNNRNAVLNRRTVDLIPGQSRTLSREVNDGPNNDAYDFSPPYFHDEMIFAGPMPYGVCAEQLSFNETNSLGYDCRNTTICVTDGSTWFDALVGRLQVPAENIIKTITFRESLAKHVTGDCNAIVGETARLSLASLRDAGYPFPTEASSEEYYVGVEKHSTEQICLMYRSDDSQFSDFIKWIVFGLIYAEENEIGMETSFEMPTTRLFGNDLSNIWQDSVGAVGNYGEMYERNLGSIVPREGRNLLNHLSSPQLFAAPGTV